MHNVIIHQPQPLMLESGQPLKRGKYTGEDYAAEFMGYTDYAKRINTKIRMLGEMTDNESKMVEVFFLSIRI